MSISKVNEKYFGKGNGIHKLNFGANKLEGVERVHVGLWKNHHHASI
jgi:hypothetical protein